MYSKYEYTSFVDMATYCAPVAHLAVHRAVTQKVVSSRLRPDQHSGSLNNWREKCCFCNSICKWLDFLVFSDKDDKPEVPSHNYLNVDNSVGRYRTHALFV